jgi:hypothetical protein
MDQDHVSVLHRNGHVEVGVPRVDTLNGKTIFGQETISIPGPLCEFYLADHRRFDPMATLHFGSSQPLVPTASASWLKAGMGGLLSVREG